VHFRLRRISGLLKTLMTNRMAAVGLVILLGSIVIAVGAPLFTAYKPDQQLLSGPYSQPEWVMSFPDGYRLSKNVVVVDDPFFNSPASLAAWSVTASPSTVSNLVLSYAQGTSSTPASKGSLQMAYTGAGPGTLTLSRTFHYPYHGPPWRFVASLAYLTSGATTSNPIQLSASIDKIGDQAFAMWSGNATYDGQWAKPGYTLDSNNLPLQNAMGLTGATNLTPAQIVFSTIQDYTYKIQVTFNGPQRINFDELQLRLDGTAWGLLGTDFQGSDVYSQLVYGSRISLIVGLTAAAIGIGLGLIIGLMAGFLGPLIDEVLMRFTDMILVIPNLPLLIVLIAVLGANITNIILIIGLFAWMGFARIVRSQVLSLKERPFVEAARASGSGPVRTMFTHIFPNIVSLTYVNLALAVPGAILLEAALEFLGLGDPNVISWGHMFYLAEVSNALNIWWWVIPPGLAIAAVSLSFVLIGYALDEIFNPKLRKRR
jgi:peptide/nickel transport system permease protein